MMPTTDKRSPSTTTSPDNLKSTGTESFSSDADIRKLSSIGGLCRISIGIFLVRAGQNVPDSVLCDTLSKQVDPAEVSGIILL